MSLQAGQTLSSYEIVALVGRGGMGEVYRARDPRLDRDVAIKVLPAELASDQERLLRFQREAKLLASLDHPHVAAIHGFETVDLPGTGATAFLVLEFVEGRSLAERLDDGPLPVDETIEVCEQIARGLEAAHDKGIVHRDLKPHNVMLRPDGTVKVLDFGLARDCGRGSSTGTAAESPTITADHTAPGVVLGTAAYMSPEQARGRSLDHRTDIWSFGCVLYECLTGTVLFGAGSATECLGAILHTEPDWDLLPDGTPPELRLLLRRCLAKDRRRRLQAIGDARIELEELLDPSRAPVSAPPLRGPGRSPVASGAAAAMLLGAGLVAGWLLPGAPTPPGAVRRLAIRLPAGLPLNTRSVSPVAISPDGSHLVLEVGTRPSTQLYLRRLDEYEAQPLPETLGATAPFFSPDSRWVGYTDLIEGKLKKIAVTGGAPVVLADVTEPWGATWAPDGTIVYTPVGTSPLWRVDASGGSSARPLTTLDPGAGEQEHAFPSVLPDGRHVLFNIWVGGTYGSGRIAVASLATGETRVVLEGGGVPHYSPTGHLVYFRRGDLLAVPFDPDRLEVTGSPVPVAGSVLSEPRYELPVYGLSAAGHLVYAEGADVDVRRTLVWVDRRGSVEPVTEERRMYEDVDLSPDGQRIAYATMGEDQDVWILDLQRQTRRRMTAGDASHGSPRWSPDGSRILYGSSRAGLGSLYIRDVDGDAEEPVFAAASSPVFYGDWRDARTVAAVVEHASSQQDIWLVDLDESDNTGPLLDSPAAELDPAFAPSGQVLAYVSDRSGSLEVYVRFLADPVAEIQVSTDGGTLPFWSADGSELFFQSRVGSPRRLFAVARDAADPRQFGLPRQLLSVDDVVFWDVVGDATRFLGVQSPPTPDVRHLNVVLDWATELAASGDGRRAP